jgi:hypothetical protein
VTLSAKKQWAEDTSEKRCEEPAEAGALAASSPDSGVENSYDRAGIKAQLPRFRDNTVGFTVL